MLINPGHRLSLVKCLFLLISLEQIINQDYHYNYYHYYLCALKSNGSDQEFAVVSKWMSKNAAAAGALNFTDPSKQAAVMSLAHMRGAGGAQAVLNSMVTGDISKTGSLTDQTITYLQGMKATDFQANLQQARLAYDKAIYGNTITTKGGVKSLWWDKYGDGLTKRYARESTDFLKLAD